MSGNAYAVRGSVRAPRHHFDRMSGTIGARNKTARSGALTPCAPGLTPDKEGL